MTDVAALKAANAARWKAMHIDPARSPLLDHAAENLIAAKAKAHYQAVNAATKVPWCVIAVIHEREASQSWLANLANGDPWNRPTIHVPKGRGPFVSWEEAAIDALKNCAPYAARWTDWSIGGLLTLLEDYNGLGYAARDLPSPYVWAGTDQYLRGKFVADGHFDPYVVDRQLGCAALLARMAAMDKSIELGAFA